MMHTTNKLEDREVITAKEIDDLFNRIEWSLIVQPLKECNGFTGLMKRIQVALVQRIVKEHNGEKTSAARFLNRTYRWLRKSEVGHSPRRD